MRYVTLVEHGPDDLPLHDEYTAADREEVTPCVMEHTTVPVPVMVDEVVEFTFKDLETGELITAHAPSGRRFPHPSATVEQPVERLVDAGGELRVFEGDHLLHTYPAGVWKSCSERPPHFLIPYEQRDYTRDEKHATERDAS